MQKILIIQTAFIGDVVLATALIEKLHIYFPDATIDFLLRKGNESLLLNNPSVNDIIVWDKKKNKTANLFRILQRIRHNRYDVVVNPQRYFSTGILTAFSGAKQKIGFDKNPLSFLFSNKVCHSTIVDNRHEVERNNDLIKHLTDESFTKPKLYPSASDFNYVRQFCDIPFVTMTPSSVWFTKKYPLEKWRDLIDNFDPAIKIFILGGKDNITEADQLIFSIANKNVQSLCGKLSFLQSAALMKNALMNYTNDSAPLHFSSAMNAPVTAIFCSTVPEFGYGPLSDVSIIIQTREKLSCKPCGVHGRRECPLGHFKCAHTILTEQLLQPIAI